jgi:hypothetical protein
MRALSWRQTTHHAVLAIAVSAMLTAVVATSPREATAQSTPSLVDLSGPDAFKKQFNEDRGHARLVLLLSPT